MENPVTNKICNRQVYFFLELTKCENLGNKKFYQKKCRFFIINKYISLLKSEKPLDSKYILKFFTQFKNDFYHHVIKQTCYLAVNNLIKSSMMTMTLMTIQITIFLPIFLTFLNTKPVPKMIYN